MAYVDKTLNELNTDSATRLQNLGYSDAAYKGSTSRNILESVDGKLFDFAQALKSGLADQFLSTASGTFLDQLGLLVGCARWAGENDDNYRYRISRALTLSKTANTIALLTALRSLSNVRDIVLKRFTAGAGTATFYLIPITGTIDATTLGLAQTALDTYQACGAYTQVLAPTTLLLNLTGLVAIAPTATNPAAVRAAAASAISTYIAGLSMGDTFVIDKAIAAVMNASSDILDFNLQTISTTLNNVTTQQILQNYTPLFDQELQPGSILLS